MRTLKLIAGAVTLVLASACTVMPGLHGSSFGDPHIYQPNADGPAATLGATAIIPSQHIAFASNQTGAPGAFGSGTARFNGISLEAFSMDGELSAIPPANAQAGFFLRPTTTLSSGGTRGLGIGGGSGGSGGVLSDTVQADADSLIAWGRWSGTSARLITRDNLVPLGEFFYVIGQITPVPRLPQSGLARYKYRGGDYATARSEPFARLSVLWGSGTAKVGLAIDAGLGYRLATTGGVSDPSPSELSLRPGTATFGGAVPTTRGSNQFGPLPCGACQGTVEGFFAGPDAERAGVSFQVIDSPIVLSGAWAFELMEPPAPVAPAPTPPPTPAFVPLDPAGPFDMARAGGPDIAATSLASIGVVTQNQATGAIEGFGQSAFTNELARGAAQSADVGGDALITWGRWTNGSYEQVQTFGNTPIALGAEQALHYVIGATTPAANIPASGTASFSLLGATKPTFGDGALAAGALTGSMAVSWGGQFSTKVGMDLTVTMPGDASYSVVTAGGLAAPSLSQVQTFFGAQFFGTVPVASAGRACASNPAGCGANIAGFFAGPAAERAGIAYQLGSGNAQQSIHGAAAFKR